MPESAFPVRRALGKRPARPDARTLRLARYMDVTRLPKPPTSVRWSDKVTAWPMYQNDRLGDCTAAAVGHMVQCWTANAQQAQITVTDDDVVRLYEQVSGYNPATGANDNGAVILDVLKRWHKDGIAGHKIGAFAAVDHRNHSLVKTAVWLFGGLDVGINLPLAAQTMGDLWQTPHGGVHGPGGAPGSWGGHSVCVVDCTPHGLVCVSWGQLIHMTWGFWNAYIEHGEVFACITADWFDPRALTPNGFNLNQLAADLANIGPIQ